MILDDEATNDGAAMQDGAEGEEKKTEGAEGTEMESGDAAGSDEM